MCIDQVNIYSLLVPLKIDLSISYETINASRPVVVEVVANRADIRGYGEGLPVQEVTGETPEIVIRNLIRFVKNPNFPREIYHVDQIFAFLDSLPKGKQFHAAICAMELALLDALGKYEGKSLTDYFSHEFWTNKVRYGVIIPILKEKQLIGMCSAIKEMKLTDLRIKMGNSLDQNEMCVRLVREILSERCNLRADVNRAWDLHLARQHISLIKNYGIRVIEEPMPPGEKGFQEFAASMKDIGVTLMACESAPSFEDIKRIVQEGYFEMVNVRVSRSGGLRKALRIIHYLRNHGISFQIGCSRGETGILSAAGRALALLCKDAVYVDGSYDAFLLKENITTEDVSFGLGGEAGPLLGNGLGVEVEPDRISSLCVKSHSISISRAT
ncbi:MAG: hypothetical protein JRJ13_01120 [Deltaproteobacteria bacterium]|nr:hypothetical protein [Deltaproteobacteria bacterium]